VPQKATEERLKLALAGAPGIESKVVAEHWGVPQSCSGVVHVQCSGTKIPGVALLYQ